MLFFYFELRWNQYDSVKMARNYKTRVSFELEAINDMFFNQYALDEEKMICATECKDFCIEVYAAIKVGAYNDRTVIETLLGTFSDCNIHCSREVTIDEFKRKLEMSTYCNSRKILTKLKLDYRTYSLYDPCPYEWTEQVIDFPKLNKSQAQKRAVEILGSQSLNDELERIYSNKNKKEYYGHPVHYFLSAGDWGAARDIYELMISALGSNGRLVSNRLSVFKNFKKGAYRDERYRQHLSVSDGGIVILELCSDSGQGRFASDFHEFTKVTGQILEEMKKDTLFIFVEIMGKSLKNGDALGNIISKADIIQVTEGSGTYEQASAYLTELVDKSDIVADDINEALEFLPKAESYTVTDIFKAYNTWYGSGLKNHIYKAYKKEDCCKIEISEAANKPYEDLKEMIGLTEAKSVIDSIVSTGKVRCLREQMGLKTEGLSLNMMFAGNPGTAKTTVARLLTQILKDEDVIKSGKLVECGRQDIVGKYVGWTAKIVEDKFKEADGGVLFIDEAYSLADDSNTYGTEAINTITQLMENYRDRVIIIFAGYPDKMKYFLEQNEGLRSRISFHLNFPDYTPDELVGILSLHARKREYEIPEKALDVCRDIFDKAVEQQNFGNGRYVRNLLEQAVIRQSDRLVKSNGDITADDMRLLAPEDFKPVTLGVKDLDEIRMGFEV